MHFSISDGVRRAEFYLPVNKRQAEAVRAALYVLQHVAGNTLVVRESVSVQNRPIAATEPPALGA